MHLIALYVIVLSRIILYFIAGNCPFFYFFISFSFPVPSPSLIFSSFLFILFIIICLTGTA